jgi:Mce-associated membrane protein
MTPTRARRAAWWVLVFVLTGATVGAATLGGWQTQIKSQQPPPVADQLAERQAAVQAASTGTVKLLSYSPNTLEQDFSAAEAFLTGDFLTYYKQFTSQIVAPAAREKAVTTNATVLRAGVESLTSQKGSILVFVNQSTTSRDKPSPALTSNSVHVSVTKVNRSWLIDGFNPVENP